MCEMLKIAFIFLRYVPNIPDLLMTFISNVEFCQRPFLYPYEIIMWFLLSFGLFMLWIMFLICIC